MSFCCIDEQLPTGIEQKWIPVVQSCEFKDTCDAIKCFGYLCCHHLFWIPCVPANIWIPCVPANFLDTSVANFSYWIPGWTISALLANFSLRIPVGNKRVDTLVGSKHFGYLLVHQIVLDTC